MPNNGLKLHHADQPTADRIREAIEIDQHIQELTYAKAALYRGIAETMGETEGVVLDGRIVAVKTAPLQLKFIEPAIPAGLFGANAP